MFSQFNRYGNVKMAWLDIDESKFQSSFINIAAEQVNIGIYSSTIDNNPRSSTEEIPSLGVYIRGGVKFRKITGKYTPLGSIWISGHLKNTFSCCTVEDLLIIAHIQLQCIFPLYSFWPIMKWYHVHFIHNNTYKTDTGWLYQYPLHYGPLMS